MENEMTAPSRQQFTQLLVAWSGGDESSLEELVPLVEVELRRLARGYMNQERPGHVLQPTALINEAYVRLIDWKNVKWQNRAHFLGVCAQIMRRVLVDYARSQNYQKRGGDAIKVTFDEALTPSRERPPDLVELDDALKGLATLDERKSKVVELRFFGGLSEEETAEVLQISPRTVRREWSLAQAWLYNELRRKE
jgi:RNA polymerase sigma-70 factor (ECF subfamily)